MMIFNELIFCSLLIEDKAHLTAVCSTEAPSFDKPNKKGTYFSIKDNEIINTTKVYYFSLMTSKTLSGPRL